MPFAVSYATIPQTYLKGRILTMSIFDRLKNQAINSANQAARSQVNHAVNQAANQVAQNLGSGTGAHKSASLTLDSLPTSLEEFASLPQTALITPFDTAALFIFALTMYKTDKNSCIAMINLLKGPQPLNAHDISFISDRMAQNGKAAFIAESYFSGATPQNNYQVAAPYTVVVSEGPYSYQEQGYASLWVRSGGADNMRSIKMRQAKDGKWYLWEYSSILLDIRAPESTNPWV